MFLQFVVEGANIDVRSLRGRRIVVQVQVKSSQELLPKYIEQDAKQGPSSQFEERAGSGLRACFSSEGFLNHVSLMLMQRDEVQRIGVQ